MSTIYQEFFDVAPSNEQHYIGSAPFCYPNLSGLGDHGVSMAGVSYINARLHVERIGAPFHVVLVSVEGHGELIEGKGTRPLGPGQLAILPAHGHSGFRFTGQPWRLVWFLLEDVPAWDALHGPQVSTRQVSRAENLFHAVALLCEEVKQPHDAFSAAAMLLAVDLLKRMLTSTEMGDEITSRLRVLFDAVRREPAKPWRVDQLAAQYGVCRAQLQRLCVRYLGAPPQQMIINMRMARARELLWAGFGNVGEVAEAVGYEEVASFSRRFTLHFGSGPSDLLRERARAQTKILPGSAASAAGH
ncbi:helix-turn-helix transcriptional regulator [Andreprevotia chitinilytica]|uniref:helix-turn-helix transcriptional regulator n=1 Tax=Andreprevotia chitinilytica TaxID=396808 RepID=UPI000556568E|nr:AraC family transcriptional regulator [Andreprevotia chitinilytica]